ncbi:uncharacterized protein LOC144744353 [Ciona intestinalis]
MARTKPSSALSSLPPTIFARMWPCDISDDRQQFFWWSNSALVNMATKQCLTIDGDRARHGQMLYFTPCNRRRYHSYQAWRGEKNMLFTDWKPNTGPGTPPPLLRFIHDPAKQLVYLDSMRRKLFVVHSTKLGMIRPTTLFSKTPAGRYILLRSSNSCISHDYRHGFDLISTAACSQHDVSLRWIVLDGGRLMNGETGMCLAAYEMQAYGIARTCSETDGGQIWIWDKEQRSGTIQHQQTQYYLKSGCEGLSSVCLTPTPGAIDMHWEFVPYIPPPATNVSLGYSFTIQNTDNLTLCGYPIINGKLTNNSRIRIIFMECKIEDPAFLWTLTGLLTQIKHRNLDLCMDADPEDYSSSEITLLPCSTSRLQHQSWMIEEGPKPRDPNQLPGDFIYLASDTRYRLAVEPISNMSMVLVLERETKSDKWEALTLRGNVVNVEEMADCTLPWTKMKLYKGTRSWTRDGIRCQPWKSLVPHRHPFNPKKYVSSDLRENKCRRPPGPPTKILNAKSEDHAWCMTLKPTVQWQDCLVSRCPLPAVVALHTSTQTWEVNLGDEALPFTCQTPAECYYGVGLNYAGNMNWTGRGYCLNWREYYNGSLDWPDHRRCANPSRTFMKPWCYVRRNVPQYCALIKKCVGVCSFTSLKLNRMKLASIEYYSPSYMYATGSKVQLVCKPGYNISLPDRDNAQVLTCGEDGTWTPTLIECRKIYCPVPVDVSNAIFMTPRTRYEFGSKAAYQCVEGYMVDVAKINIEVTCLANGSWSDYVHECFPACPEGYTSFNRSCYRAMSHYQHFLSFNQSLETCDLAIPTNQVVYSFIKWLIAQVVTARKITYWLGVKDIASNTTNMQARSWVDTDHNDQLYLKDLEQFHSFMIRNHEPIKSLDVRLRTPDRCMYGKNNATKVFMKSCFAENKTGLNWTWLTHDQLYNIDTDKCLTATTTDGVSLEPCKFDASNQSFTCGPQSAYSVKLRKEAGGYLSISDDLSEVELSETPSESTMWETMNYYLCHWNIKPPDSVFIVNRGPVPLTKSFMKEEGHKCLENQTNAQIASETDINQVMESEIPAWCQCTFMHNRHGGQITSTLIQNDECTEPSNYAKTGLKECENIERADTWCVRRDGSSPSNKPIPQWCVTLTLTTLHKYYLQPRFCSNPVSGHVCHTKAVWSCDQPFQPPNTIPQFESSNFMNMQFAYDHIINIKCIRGYEFSDGQPTVDIKCNRYLKWEMLKESNPDELEYYVDDRISREESVFKLKCVPLHCPRPPVVTGMILTVHSFIPGLVALSYPYKTRATYTCLVGLELSPGVNTRNITCTHDGTWHKPLDENDICKPVSG